MKVYSPLKGKVVSLEEVSDPVFSQKMMGDGVAIKPEDNQIYAPVAGVLTSVFPTKHAFGIRTQEGVELLIHIGLDTVNLKGKYFDLKVAQGDQVEVGDLLVEVDFSALTKEGYDVITPIVILDLGSYKEIGYEVDQKVTEKDVLLQIS